MGIDRLEDVDSSQTAHTSRRNVLIGAGAVGAAAVAGLAACGTSGGGSDASGGTPAAGSSAASGTNLTKTADIPVGGGKIFDAQQVVVTQPTAGAFKAFSAVCTHQGCLVTEVKNGLIICPCHGSQYSITDGAVKQAAESGQKPLPAKQVTVANGEISVA